MEQQPEGMTPQKMSGKVLDKFLVDVFKPKNGNEKDIVVFTFLVNQKESATNLHRFISKGPFDLIDVEASPAPDEDGNYLVFVEMDRSRDMFGIMDDILQHIDYLVDVHHWQFRPYSHNTFIEWNRDNFIKTVPQNSAEYSGERPKSKFVDAGDTFTPSKELMESNQLLLRQFIDKQINRHSKAYIQSLQDQIHSVIQDNQRLLEHIEELKLEQQQLHQQLNSYQKREDMSLQREEKIYSKIRDLENQVTRFAASNYQNSSDMNDTEIVAESSSTFESIDSRQEVEELVSVAEIEEIENEADDDLDATSELQFDDDFEFESDLIEMEEQLHSDALSEEASGQKVEEQEEIENEVAIAPEVDELHSDESGVPLEPPGLSNEYFADENGRKEQSDTIDKGTDTIKSEDDSFTEYVHDDDFVADIDDEVGISEVSGEDEIEEIEPLSSQEEDDSLDTLLELESILESENAIKDTEILKINSEPEYASVEDQNGAIEQTDVPEDIDEDVHDLDTIVEVEDDDRISATAAIPTDDDISQSELISHQEIEPDQEEVIHELETIVHEDEVSSDESEPILIEDALSEKEDAKEVGPALDYTSDDSEVTKQALEKIEDEKNESVEENGELTPEQTEQSDSDSPDGDISKTKATEDLEDTIHELETIVDAENTAAGVLIEESISDTDVEKDRHEEFYRSEDVNQLFLRGLRAYEKKSYVKAIEYFTMATELAPNQPTGYLNLAVIAYRLKDYETARSHAQIAFGLGSKSAEKILDKANIKLKSGKSKSEEINIPVGDLPESEKGEYAEKILVQSDETSDTMGEALDSMVKDEVIELDQPAVIDDEDKVLHGDDSEKHIDIVHEFEHSPSDEKSDIVVKGDEDFGTEKAAERDIANEYITLGLAATDQKKFSKAIEHFTKASKISPDMPSIYLNLSVLKYRLKDYETAQIHALRAIELGSKSAEKILDKINAKLNAKTKQDADEAVETATEQDIAHETEMDLKDTESQNDVYTEKLDGARKTDKNTISGEKARDLEDIKEVTPAHKPIITEKTDTEISQRNIKELSDSTEEKSVEKIDDKTIGSELANQYFAKALAATEEKNYAKAIEFFNKATEISPNVPAGYLNLAVLNYRIKNYETARVHATKAVELGSKSAQKILDKANAKLNIIDDQSERKEAVSKPVIDTTDSDRAIGRELESTEKNAIKYDAAERQPNDDSIVFEKPEVLVDAKNFETTSDTVQPDSTDDERDLSVADVAEEPKKVTSKQSTYANGNERELANEYFRLGEDAVEQKAYHKAIKCFEKVTELLPRARRSYIKLAVLYYQLKNFQTAKDYAQKALDLGSTSAHKILNKAQSKLDAIEVPDWTDKKNQVLGKEEVSQKEATMPKDTVDHKAGIASVPGQKPANVDKKSPLQTLEEDVLVQTPEQKEAAPKTEPPAQSTEGSVADNYTVNEYFAMGLAASERQDYEQAIEYFTKVTELIPNASSSFLNLANLFYNLKDYETAEKHAQKALDLGSKSAQRLLDDIAAISKETN